MGYYKKKSIKITALEGYYRTEKLNPSFIVLGPENFHLAQPTFQGIKEYRMSFLCVCIVQKDKSLSSCFGQMKATKKNS